MCVWNPSKQEVKAKKSKRTKSEVQGRHSPKTLFMIDPHATLTTSQRLTKLCLNFEISRHRFIGMTTAGRAARRRLKPVLFRVTPA